MYFESISNMYGWLEKSPNKHEVLKNADKIGAVSILPNSYNRAIIIETDTETYLQSYDTLILKVDKASRTISKLWDDYSKTTLKHINEFMTRYTHKATSFNKAEWLRFKACEF